MYQLQLGQIGLFVLVGFALPAVGMILLAWGLQLFLGYHRPNAIKNQPYECGMKPMQGAHVQFDIRYYLYALLFILFDIEIVFIVPWILATDNIGGGLVGTGLVQSKYRFFWLSWLLVLLMPGKGSLEVGVMQ